MGQCRNINKMLTLLIYIDCIISILFFLAKWGNGLVEESIAKAKRTSEAIDKLNLAMRGINHNSQKLNENMALFDKSTDNIKEAILNTSTAMQEMSEGINEQAYNLSNINEKVYSISAEINENLNMSREISDDSIAFIFYSKLILTVV
jgi:methyl-accepting chemotaxis protein